MDSFSLTHKTLILLLLLLSLSLVLHLFWNMRRRAVQPITKRRSIQILTEFKVELKNVLLFASLSSFRFGIFCHRQIATKYDSILKSNVKTLRAPTEDKAPRVTACLEELSKFQKCFQNLGFLSTFYFLILSKPRAKLQQLHISRSPRINYATKFSLSHLIRAGVICKCTADSSLTWLSFTHSQRIILLSIVLWHIASSALFAEQ